MSFYKRLRYPSFEMAVSFDQYKPKAGKNLTNRGGGEIRERKRTVRLT